MSNETKKEECCEKCKGSGSFYHTVGSHSDDRGGDSDLPCLCTENDCFHLSTDKKPCPCHSSPHIPTGEDWEKEFEERFGTGIYFRYATQETEDKLCYQERKDVVKQFISDILLSKEKQWKDEMAGKIPKYRSFEESNSVEYYHGRNDFRNEMLSLLSNNQEDK